MDSSTYRHLMGQTPKSCHLPHYYFPSHNLVSLETVRKVSENDENGSSPGFFEKFPCYESFQYEVLGTLALHNGSGEKDYAYDLVKKKAFWERQLTCTKVKNVEKATQIIRKLYKNEQVPMTKSVSDYIEFFNKDPEPVFEGMYNWLYTGGSINVAEHSHGVLLLSADYCDKKSGFSLVKLDESLSGIEFKTFYPLKSHSPVLQILSKANGNNLLVLVRQKNNVNLLKFDCESYLNMPENLWRKKSSTSKLLTCIDINSEKTEVAIANSNQDVHIFDVETKTKSHAYSLKKQKKIYSKTRDSWNQVLFEKQNIYVGLRNGFCIFDLRDDNSGPKLLYSPSQVVNLCEDLCCITKSKYNNNYVYLGTNHNFLQFDIRTGKTVQRWTHLFEFPPQFTSVVKDGNHEFIVLQSHLIDEMSGITNEYVEKDNEVIPISNSLPCVLNGNRESLKLAHFNGLCLNPHLSKRFEFKTTGVKLLKGPQNSFLLYVGNGCGDVFLSKLKKKESCIEEDEIEMKSKILESMKCYESHFENFPSKRGDQNAMQMIDMSHLLKELVENKMETSKKFTKPELDWRYHEMYSPESLSTYRDVIAKKIMGIWKFDSEDTTFLDSTTSSVAKVQEWMEKM